MVLTLSEMWESNSRPSPAHELRFPRRCRPSINVRATHVCAGRPPIGRHGGIVAGDHPRIAAPGRPLHDQAAVRSHHVDPAITPHPPAAVEHDRAPVRQRRLHRIAAHADDRGFGRFQVESVESRPREPRQAPHLLAVDLDAPTGCRCEFHDVHRPRPRAFCPSRHATCDTARLSTACSVTLASSAAATVSVRRRSWSAVGRNRGRGAAQAARSRRRLTRRFHVWALSGLPGVSRSSRRRVGRSRAFAPLTRRLARRGP